MATVNLGRVSFVMKGDYSDSATYKRLDVVTSNGTSYAAKQDVPAGTALTNTAYWQAQASKGEAGTNGTDGLNYSVSVDGSELKFESQNDLAEELSALKSSNYKKARGKKIVIPNGIGNAIVTAPNGATVLYANNSANVIKKTKAGSNVPTTYGLKFAHYANNCIHVNGNPTITTTLNRYYNDGFFQIKQADADPILVSDGQTLYTSAYIVFNSGSSPDNGAALSVFAYDQGATVASATRLLRITRYPTTPDVFFVDSGTPTAGQNVTMSVAEYGVAGGTSRVVDYTAYIFLSTNESDMLHAADNGVVPLYRNSDTIIISDQIIEVEYMSEDAADTVGDEIDICAYNVGHFSNGSSTPAGTDTMLNKFVSTFQEMGKSVYLFSEWDEEYSSSKHSENVFGALRKYWSTQETKEKNEYIFQKVASPYRILYEQANYFNADSSSNRYFLDCVVGSKFGDNVHLISTHLSFNEHSLRLQQIQEILDYLTNNGIDNAIIGGDFNNGLSNNGADTPTSWSEALTMINEDISKWTNADYISAQGSFFGDAQYGNYMHTGTTTSTILPVQPFDNVIVSPGMQILNFKTVSNGESDHKAVFAEIKIR